MKRNALLAFLFFLLLCPAALSQTARPQSTQTAQGCDNGGPGGRLECSPLTVIQGTPSLPRCVILRYVGGRYEWIEGPLPAGIKKKTHYSDHDLRRILRGGIDVLLLPKHFTGAELARVGAICAEPN